MLRLRGHPTHGQSRPRGHLSRKGDALLHLVLLLLSLAAPSSDSAQNLDPDG